MGDPLVNLPLLRKVDCIRLAVDDLDEAIARVYGGISLLEGGYNLTGIGNAAAAHVERLAG